MAFIPLFIYSFPFTSHVLSIPFFYSCSLFCSIISLFLLCSYNCLPKLPPLLAFIPNFPCTSPHSPSLATCFPFRFFSLFFSLLFLSGFFVGLSSSAFNTLLTFSPPCFYTSSSFATRPLPVFTKRSPISYVKICSLLLRMFYYIFSFRSFLVFFSFLFSFFVYISPCTFFYYYSILFQVSTNTSSISLTQ